LDELKKKRFLWDVALAWTPAVPAVIGLSNALRGMSKSKGQPGLPRWLAVWLRCSRCVGSAPSSSAKELRFSYCSGHSRQEIGCKTCFPILSICLSVLMLLFVGSFLWLM